MPVCRHFLVSGRVQGVFYRASTRETARRLGLTGWVRNREDGRVEVVACGDEKVLEQLWDWLQQGPPHASVEQVQTSPVEAEAFADFDVRY